MSTTPAQSGQPSSPSGSYLARCMHTRYARSWQPPKDVIVDLTETAGWVGSATALTVIPGSANAEWPPLRVPRHPRTHPTSAPRLQGRRGGF